MRCIAILGCVFPLLFVSCDDDKCPGDCDADSVSQDASLRDTNVQDAGLDESSVLDSSQDDVSQSDSSQNDATDIDATLGDGNLKDAYVVIDDLPTEFQTEEDCMSHYAYGQRCPWEKCIYTNFSDCPPLNDCDKCAEQYRHSYYNCGFTDTKKLVCTCACDPPP